LPLILTFEEEEKNRRLLEVQKYDFVTL